MSRELRTLPSVALKSRSADGLRGLQALLRRMGPWVCWHKRTRSSLLRLDHVGCAQSLVADPESDIMTTLHAQVI